LDYIDLYLYLHWPMTNATDLSTVSEQEMVGYDPQSAANTWEVYSARFMSTFALL